MPLSPRSLLLGLLPAALVAGAVAPAAADSTAGVDAALVRPSYDTSGLFSLEGARLPPRHDLSWKMWLSYAQHPFDVAVPGIGDGGVDHVLGYDVTLDLAFGFTVSERLGFGLGGGAAGGEREQRRGQRGDDDTTTKQLVHGVRCWALIRSTRSLMGSSGGLEPSGRSEPSPTACNWGSGTPWPTR